MTTFYCRRFAIPPTGRTRSPYLYPPGTGWLGYPPKHWVVYILSLILSLMLRPTVRLPVCLAIEHPSGANGHIFITVRHMRVCWCGLLSLARGRVCRLQLLLVLASAVILGSESRGTRDHILLSQIRDCFFRRLLRRAGLPWSYLPHGILG
jgi:hypothetical protein